MNTKEKILVTALRLFAVYGYEAVSVSRIAGELGITKGALYKHYKNKRDIFNCIFEYVCQLDVERSRKSGVPEQDYSDMPEAFSHVLPKSLGDYMKAQFHYWSEDEIACNFRKMLTLEQYKSSEMSALYQKVLVSGPLEYIERLLCEMSKRQKKQLPSPHALAIEFYSPFYLLLSMSDGVERKETKEEIAKSYECYIDDFLQRHFSQKLKEETFGPVSIHPGYQRMGYGKMLMEHSFQSAIQLGYDTIVIFGSPVNYVSRGFKSCKKYNVCIESGKYPAAMMVKELRPHALDGHKWVYQDSPVMAISEEGAERYDAALEPMEKKHLPSQEEFYIMSRSFVEG